MTPDSKRPSFKDQVARLRARLRSDRRARLILALTLALAAALLVVGVVQKSLWQQDARFGTSGGEKGRIEAIVRDYILEHPEIIPEAIKRLQDREIARLLASNREAIETPYEGAWAGAADGDVTLVEFFDYACPYCKAAAADVNRLLAEDKSLKVVWREFPVLGAASDEAAMVSLAAARQNRYRAFHDRMFAADGAPSHERTIATIRAAGVNEGIAARDIGSDKVKAEIGRNLDLGKALGLTGTPSFVVGNRILQGAVGYDALKQAIAEARKGKSRW